MPSNMTAKLRSVFQPEKKATLVRADYVTTVQATTRLRTCVQGKRLSKDIKRLHRE
jgi:hypothetical protein